MAETFHQRFGHGRGSAHRQVRSRVTPEPTAAAMRLAEEWQKYDAACQWEPPEGYMVGLARTLDDAGVRETVESCNKMIEIAESRETLIVRLVAMEGLAHRALSALTGSKETRDE